MVAEVIKKRRAKQVFTKVPHTRGGHHASPGSGLYQHDLISMEPVQGSRNNGFKWIYVIINVWSRKIFARKSREKDPESIRDCLQSIIQGMPAAERPKDITGDDDGAFKGAFRQYLDGQGIGLRMTTEKEGKSVIDAAIYHMKRALYSDMQRRNSTQWAVGDTLARIVAGQNARAHSSLGMAAPDDVGTGINTWLQYGLLVRNTKHLEQNAKAWNRTRRGLEVGDKFRAPAKRKQRGFQRGYTMTYEKDVLTVASFRNNGQTVVATDGSTHKTSRVLPVPADSVRAETYAMDYAERTRREQIREQRGFV